MGILNQVTQFSRRITGIPIAGTAGTKSARKCQLESLEPRQLLAADVLLGGVYFEEATGDDSAADVIQITFSGGAQGTTLDRLVIDGDKSGDGLSAGDVFYDIAAGGLGAFNSVGLTIESQVGFQVTGFFVSDGGSQIGFEFLGFDAGEQFVFSVDADEIQFVEAGSLAGGSADPSGIDTNSLVEGAEFQRSVLEGQFSAPNYEDLVLNGIFWDLFDERFVAAQDETNLDLDLPGDKFSVTHDFSDRTAGAVSHAEQVALPTISGTVFHDMNLDNRQAPDMDQGIAGVQLALWIFDEDVGDYVDTGLRATTDDEGHYLFEDASADDATGILQLPGAAITIHAPKGRFTEVQVVVSRANLQPAAFPTVRFEQETEQVVLEVSDSALTRVGDMIAALQSAGFKASADNPDSFFNPATPGIPTAMLTGGARRLHAGRYEVRESQPPGYYSVGAQIGTIDGVASGQVLSKDVLSSIELPAGADSVQNNFAEALPAGISGFVYEDNNDDGVFQQDVEAGIEGTLIRVTAVSTVNGSDAVRTTFTDPDGAWQIDSLVPGEYFVEEITPAGYVDGKDTAGIVAGEQVGRAENPGDRIVEIALGGGKQGVFYNFGELKLAEIRGRVHLSLDGDCDFQAPGISLSGVQIDLLDAAGNFVRSTRTDASGAYVFSGVAPGNYQIQEHTPSTFQGRRVFDGSERVGSAGGRIVADDRIADVVITPGASALNYDFCELVGAGISGFVYHDANNNGVFETTETPIQGAVVELVDPAGNPTGITVATGVNGYYEFRDLPPGKWSLRETTPAGYLDGLDTAGTHGRRASNPGDRIDEAMLGFGDFAQHYNFGELLPAVIGGRIHASSDGDCDFDNPEILLAGVRVDLLDAFGNLIDSQFTDADGRYRFAGLRPGEYQLVEYQPSEFNGLRLFDGEEQIGDAGGELAETDSIRKIVVASGQSALGYNFCEHVGTEISGFVYHDRSNDGVRDPDEEGIPKVTVKLLDANGLDTGLRATTDANGFYRFSDLAPGKWGLMEVHPAGWLDGIDTPGNRGGIVDAAVGGDMIGGAMLNFGDRGRDYNFGELRPATLSGRVDLSTDPLCQDPHRATPLAGVTVELLDDTGDIVASTTTDDRGEYEFRGLRPGKYAVREQLLDKYFDGRSHVGNGDGVAVDPNHLANITIGSGGRLVEYNFCELPGAAISGYVFQDGPTLAPGEEVPEDPREIRDGRRTSDDTPLAGVMLELRDNFLGDPIFGAAAFPGIYPEDQPIRTITDENGYYEFTGLPAGNYSVVEIHPEGFADSLDSPGSTGGRAINPRPAGTLVAFSALEIDQFQRYQRMFGEDVIFAIALDAGDHSIENNFSELLTSSGPTVIPPIDDPPPPSVLPVLVETLPPQKPLLPLFVEPTVEPRRFGSIYGTPHTWHLSVIDAGWPRARQNPNVQMRMTGLRFDVESWQGAPLDQSAWTLATTPAKMLPGEVAANMFMHRTFGSAYAVPVVGDWNGDGISELGVFLDGEWFLDVNGNGLWDDEDLWAKLGSHRDRPVTGDWDGDGKTDIGIFGPAWRRDPQAIAAEPGIPDSANPPQGKWKNVPPTSEEATSGGRALKRAAIGDIRTDLIDHVFRYGDATDIPVTGDWNGDGIATIGVFRNGVWLLDINGDGRITVADPRFSFGTAADQPVVGDFNGDGIDDLGVFQNGKWQIDSDGDRLQTSRDRVFRLGAPGDRPVVGDWNGDGTDDPGVYHPDGQTETLTRLEPPAA